MVVVDLTLRMALTLLGCIIRRLLSRNIGICVMLSNLLIRGPAECPVSGAKWRPSSLWTWRVLLRTSMLSEPGLVIVNRPKQLNRPPIWGP